MPTGCHGARRDTSGIRPFQFKKGESGNSAGSKRAGASILEWINALAAEVKPGVGKHNLEKLRKIADAPASSKLSYTKRVAAVQLLECLRGGRYSVDAFHKLLNRMVGYPKASLSLTGELGVTQKAVIIVEDFDGCTLLDKQGRDILQHKDSRDVIQVDGKYLDGGNVVPEATDTNLLPPA